MELSRAELTDAILELLHTQEGGPFKTKPIARAVLDDSQISSGDADYIAVRDELNDMADAGVLVKSSKGNQNAYALTEHGGELAREVVDGSDASESDDADEDAPESDSEAEHIARRTQAFLDELAADDTVGNWQREEAGVYAYLGTDIMVTRIGGEWFARLTDDYIGPFDTLKATKAFVEKVHRVLNDDAESPEIVQAVLSGEYDTMSPDEFARLIREIDQSDPQRAPESSASESEDESGETDEDEFVYPHAPFGPLDPDEAIVAVENGRMEYRATLPHNSFTDTGKADAYGGRCPGSRVLTVKGMDRDELLSEQTSRAVCPYCGQRKTLDVTNHPLFGPSARIMGHSAPDEPVEPTNPYYHWVGDAETGQWEYVDPNNPDHSADA